MVQVKTMGDRLEDGMRCVPLGQINISSDFDLKGCVDRRHYALVFIRAMSVPRYTAQEKSCTSQIPESKLNRAHSLITITIQLSIRVLRSAFIAFGQSDSSTLYS